MIKVIVYIIVGTIVFAAIAQNLMIEFALNRFFISVIFVGIAIVFHITNVVLLQRFIQKNSGNIFDNEKNSSYLEDWEKTAGTGIVPKWVSLIGLMSVSAIITAILPWVIAIFK